MELSDIPAQDLRQEASRLTSWTVYSDRSTIHDSRSFASPTSHRDPMHTTGAEGCGEAEERGPPFSSSHHPSVPYVSQKPPLFDTLRTEVPFSTNPSTLASSHIALRSLSTGGGPSSVTHSNSSLTNSDPARDHTPQLHFPSGTVSTNESFSTGSARTASSMPASTMIAARTAPDVSPPLPHLFSKEDITIVEPTCAAQIAIAKDGLQHHYPPQSHAHLPFSGHHHHHHHAHHPLHHHLHHSASSRYLDCMCKKDNNN